MSFLVLIESTVNLLGAETISKTILKINRTQDLRDEAFRSFWGCRVCVNGRNFHLALLERLNGTKQVKFNSVGFTY